MNRILVIVDQFQYINTLEEVMLPYTEEEIPFKSIFQQGNNPRHTSKPVHLSARAD